MVLGIVLLFVRIRKLFLFVLFVVMVFVIVVCGVCGFVLMIYFGSKVVCGIIVVMDDL